MGRGQKCQAQERTRDLARGCFFADFAETIRRYSQTSQTSWTTDVPDPDQRIHSCCAIRWRRQEQLHLEDWVSEPEIPQEPWREEPMKTKLDRYEQEIERSANSYRSLSKREHLKIETMLDKIRKTRNVNIRISESVLEQLKRRSQEEGIPYQTLISSILHKFVTDQLVDEKTILRSMQLLSSAR